MSKKILISVGGTGGHIYPAVALAQELAAKDPSIETLFIGGRLAGNAWFQSTQRPFYSISCSPFARKNPFKLFSSLTLNLVGLYESLKVIRQFRPDLIIGFGSYHSLPTMTAAQLCQIPVVLFASDTHPGKVIRLFSRFSLVTAIQFTEAAKLLKGETQLVYMPLRPGFKKDCVSRSEAIQYFNLEDNLKTLLVFGGSQGAASINQILEEVVQKKGREWSSSLQILHFTGREDACEKLNQSYQSMGFRACVKAFEERMDFAWSTADLVISRAGAATLAEQIEFEVPGILIPYPHAADNHQEKNGHVMKFQIGGAEVISEKQLSSDLLAKAIMDVFNADANKLKVMKSALSLYKRNKKAKNFSDLILDIVERLI